jgi:hypothetical protein
MQEDLPIFRIPEREEKVITIMEMFKINIMQTLGMKVLRNPIISKYIFCDLRQFSLLLGLTPVHLGCFLDGGHHSYLIPQEMTRGERHASWDTPCYQ